MQAARDLTDANKANPRLQVQASDPIPYHICWLQPGGLGPERAWSWAGLVWHCYFITDGFDNQSKSVSSGVGEAACSILLTIVFRISHFVRSPLLFLPQSPLFPNLTLTSLPFPSMTLIPSRPMAKALLSCPRSALKTIRQLVTPFAPCHRMLRSPVRILETCTLNVLLADRPTYGTHVAPVGLHSSCRP